MPRCLSPRGRLLVLGTALCSLLGTTSVVGSGESASDAGTATTEPAWTRPLYQGNLAAARQQLHERLRQQPDDAQARLGLAVTRLLGAVEGAAQGSYRRGLLPNSAFAGFLPLGNPGLPVNPDPEPVGYTDLRNGLQWWVDELARIDTVLARVDDASVKLPLRIGRVRLDFNGDGRATAAESLWRVYALGGEAGLPGARSDDLAEQAESFRIVFDHADVHWLRGYLHLLMGASEMLLAHDWQPLFARAGHLSFVRPETDYPFLQHTDGLGGFPRPSWTDIAAFIHLLDFELLHPNRMKRAHNYFRVTLRHSRQSWNAILAETDDEREWIPGPDQTGVVPGVAVTPEMVEQWRRFLTEAEALLAGEKLAPFWRGDTGKGVNLRRVFTEPRGFDLVLWVQGTDAAPYLESGEVTDEATWERFQQAFGGRFFSFAAWFN